MTVPLLNDNQQRRLGTHLRLLVSDLDALAASPELQRGGLATERVRRLVAETRAAADEMRQALSLPPDRAPSFQRRLAAVAEVWAARIEDLRARRLRGYGAVHPDLAGRLDPRVERVRKLLNALADAAALLPEEGP